MAMRTWVATYDVTSDRVRARLARLLEAGGPRVLYSVFEIRASDHDVVALLAKSERVLGQHDRLLLVPTCSNCRCWSAGTDIEAIDRPFVSWSP